MKQNLVKYTDKRYLPVCYRFNQEVFLADNFLRLGEIMKDTAVSLDHEQLEDLDFERLLFNCFRVRGGNINDLSEQDRKTLIANLKDFLIAYWR
jgi:hypothetical protein